MTSHKLSSFAAVLCFTFVSSMNAQQSPAERVAEIQTALRAAKLDGWLFYDFRHSDPLAYRILKLDEEMFASRRWFYYVPASGEPVKIVQSIEQFKLDSLPGRKLVFRGWQELHARLKEVLGASGKESKSRIAMQYSPMNDIPYISRVDAGTIELVRSFGVEPVSSAELVQRFEAVFSPAQHEMHVEASDKMHRIIQDARDSAVDFVRKNIRAGKPIRGAEVDDVSRGVITRAGFGEQFTHRTGHSIGEETHGNGVNIDDFETRDSRRIIPGVCFSIEPGIYLEGKFGVRSEINVYVSDKDIEVTGQPIQTDIIPILKIR